MQTRHGGVGRWIVIGILVLAVAAAVFAVIRRNQGPDTKRTLVEAVEAGEFVREVSGTGIVEAALERNVTFKTSGTVDEIPVNEGDDVSSGDTLAKLNIASLERDVASTRASLQSAEADLNRLDAQQDVDRLDIQSSVASGQDAVANAEQALADAERNLATIEQLFSTGAASLNELNNARDAAASAQRRLDQASLNLESASTRLASFDQLASAQRASSEAQITQLETSLANLEERIDEATLIAPFGGTVTSIDFEVGDQAAPGSVIKLVDSSSLFITANFDENRAAELERGQTATITPDADANQILDAIVRRVSTVANRTGNAAQLEVELDFRNSEDIRRGIVRPGYTVTSRVTVNALDNVLLIPLEAITERDGESFVYKVSESEAGLGTVQKAIIEVLDRNATIAAATSSNLTASDLIAVINLDELEEGDDVSYDPLDDSDG